MYPKRPFVPITTLICTQNTHFIPTSALMCTRMRHFVLKPSILSIKKHGFRTCEFATVTRLYTIKPQVQSNSPLFRELLPLRDYLRLRDASVLNEIISNKRSCTRCQVSSSKYSFDVCSSKYPTERFTLGM